MSDSTISTILEPADEHPRETDDSSNHNESMCLTGPDVFALQMEVGS